MVTMQDVANRAKVSLATVSFVLNGSKPISEGTRSRVEQAVADLGYRRNPVSAALAGGRTRILAMLYPAIDHQLSGTAVTFFTAAAERASSRGYSLVLWPVGSTREEVSTLTSTRLVDGVVVMEVQLEDDRVHALTRSDTPFALIGRTRDSADLPYVDIDVVDSARVAIEELASRGHRRVALIERQQRLEAGFATRLRHSFNEFAVQFGCSPLTMSCLENSHAGRALGKRLAREHPDVTALVVTNEHAAPGVLAGLREEGVQVPRDVSALLIGSSDDIAAMSDPPLTFLRSPSAELGRLSIDAVINRIENTGAPVPHLLVPCELVAGSSIGPVRPSQHQR